MSTEIEKFGDTLNKRMNRIFDGRSSIVAELGTITSNGGLQVPSLSNVIPKGDYLVNKTIDRVVTDTASDTGSDTISVPEHGNFTVTIGMSFSVSIPICPMGPGDRVLVLWCGNEPIVAAVLKES